MISPFTSGTFELTEGSVIHQATPSHVHTNWLFTDPGVYTMRVKASGTPVKGGATVESNTATYTFIVGDAAHDAFTSEANASSATASNPASAAASSSLSPALAHAAHAANLPGKDLTAAAANEIAGIAPAASGQGAAAQGAASGQEEKCTWVETSDKLTLTPKIKDDRQSPPAWVMPESLTFAIGDAGNASAHEALGSIPAGSSVWMISSAQVAGVPWLGLNTQHESMAKEAQGATTVSLTSFSGPGTMEVFTSGNLGVAVGTRWFTGANNKGSGSASIPANTHVHPNWVFSKAGTYKVGLTMSTTLKSGERISGTTTLTFNVGSAGNATDGHFDLGPTLGKAGAWQTPDGKPCTPGAGGSGSLSNTGSHMAELAAFLIASLSLGACVLRMRRRGSAHR